MRFSEILAASLVAPLVAAHGDIPGAPKLFGLGPNPMQKLKARNPASARRVAVSEQGPQLHARQGGQNGRCGPSFGGAKCAANYCCSSAGWCGQGSDYCEAPDCLIDYGPACDANKTPSGTTTRNVPRPQLGSIQYGGAGVYSCLKAGTVAITYDDGPYIYTQQVLDQFASYGAKATFFITGINIGKGAIDTTPAWKSVIQRMYNEGHQVASHTWSHQDLSAITQAQRFDQMVKNEMAIRNIIGKFPTYMRPPYSSCNAACQTDLKTLGYVVSYFDVDTDDYNNVTPDKIQNAKNNWNKYIVGSNPAEDEWLGIAHDIHEQTALNLTGHMLSTLTAAGYKAVTMGECMNDPKANWYRDSTGGTPTTSTGTVPTATGKTSVDGSCGGTNGYSCVGFSEGECCSQYGWCGKSTDHCGTGCNPLFGKCTGSTPSSTKPPTSTPTGKTSEDGSCGGTKGFSCIGFSEGECCSQYGWCGASTDHCGTGCNPLFGKCTSSTGTKTSAASTPSPTLKTSVDGTCGGTTGSTCKGFSEGTCCSQHGWCGKTTDHCGTGCNPAFGTCGSSVSNSSDSSDSISPSTTFSILSSVSVSTKSSSTSVTTTRISTGSPVSSKSSSLSVSSKGVSTGSPISSKSSSRSVSSSGLSTRSPISSTPSPSKSLQSTRQSSSSVAGNSPSTISTFVRPTTTIRTSTATPSPTSNVSKDGKCGQSNNKQTCKGYRNMPCCGSNGRCGNSMAACGFTCNKNYGDCWWF